MNEAETRAELIDKQLVAVGWKTGGDVHVFREYNIDNPENRGNRTLARKRFIADYVLAYKRLKLAVIEAKSDEIDVSEGVAQAKKYAQKMGLQTSFAANGKSIYQINHKSGKEGEVTEFPSPQELWQSTFSEANEWLERFNAEPIVTTNINKQARYYQELAINRAVEAIANDRQRVLLTLATGTGKTFIASQIAWKLFKSRWTRQKDGMRQPRILFLVDRNILIEQAYLGFDIFNPDALVRIRPRDIAKYGGVPKNGSVFFTIYQTFMSGEDDAPYFGEYEKDFFDLVIVDECHRGGADNESKWRRILDHFSDAVHLGLTATPKRTDNIDTYDYFGDPVFIYSLKDGIEDGFLTPFKVKSIESTIDQYIYSPDDDVLEGEVQEEHVYEENEFNKSIEIRDRERKRVQDMMANINREEKTIVFCSNQAHAALIRDLINQESESKNTDYCARVTANDGDNGETYLNQFRDNEKSIPTILTTSRKLTTGVDARNVRNIVLLRPVNNMVEFKQIIGRGTRLYEGKHYFTIIDFVRAYHHFNDEEWDGEPVNISESGTRREKADDDKKSTSRESGSTDVELSKPELVRIKLSDGKVRDLRSITSTHFYLKGKIIDAEKFLRHLFDTVKLPELLGSEEELRKNWSDPLKRKALLEKLEERGCRNDDLKKLQELIVPGDSDLLDVLAHVAYGKRAVSRATRVEANKDNIYNKLPSPGQKEFVASVLRNYVKIGEDELNVSKLPNVLSARYGSINDAERQIGLNKKDIRNIFVDFQQYLYEEVAV